jgi:hypothetical protein
MSRINYRMITIIVVFSFLVGYPVFTFVKAQMNHGVEHDGDLYRVDLKAMGNFAFDDVNGTIANVPKQFRDLNGKKVALEGFMWNGSTSGDQVSEFQFVYNITKCCFNGPPRVQERIFAFVPEKADVNYYGYSECRLIGTLHVKVQKDDGGKVASVYTIDVNRVEPL